MKKFILGFVAVLAVIAMLYFAYPFIRGFFGGAGGGPVSPENLNPAVKEYGSLQVMLDGKVKSLVDVEVDLGKINDASGPTGPMSFAVTDIHGTATFGKVPVGDYDIFFNTNHFPSGYDFPKPNRFSVSIEKDQNIIKRIDLAPKQ